MNKTRVKPLTDAFSGFPPNRDLLDIANNFPVAYGREAMAKVMAASAALNIQNQWHRPRMQMNASASSAPKTSYAPYRPKSYKPSSGINAFASAVTSIFGTPKMAPGIGYMRASLAPAPKAFGMAA